ncbi:hypothetical protein K470DRAFT_157202 [Piedraia hortae CBS 480.64]|uniref:Uncharacterized protein n=1 Tax=Piedraia hortae CBS 480.64 TaxID=1314780 RepID=A0A6A7BTK9_9PEZI|nr:hypothetical protein K470DRAFT_157202 [Piedraia hortae CBS 480.64]
MMKPQKEALFELCGNFLKEQNVSQPVLEGGDRREELVESRALANTKTNHGFATAQMKWSKKCDTWPAGITFEDAFGKWYCHGGSCDEPSPRWYKVMKAIGCSYRPPSCTVLSGHELACTNIKDGIMTLPPRLARGAPSRAAALRAHPRQGNRSSDCGTIPATSTNDRRRPANSDARMVPCLPGRSNGCITSR